MTAPGSTSETSADTTVDTTAAADTGTETSTSSGGSDESSTGEMVDDCSGFALPGEAFYPEGIERAADGTIWVGSFVTGEIVQLTDVDAEPVMLAPPGGDVVQAVGLRYHDDLEILWTCSVDTQGMSGSSLVGISTADGTTSVTHALPPGTFCNDVATDADDNLYITDSFASQILVLDAADRLTADSLAVWSDEVVLGAGAAPGDFTLNGIAVIGSDVFTVRSDNGELYRLPILGDGSAGAAVTIDLGADLLFSADGLTADADGTLLVARNFLGVLDRVTLDGDTGTVTNIAMDLNIPATLVVDQGIALVTETQFDHLFMPDEAGPPDLPFCVAAVALD